MSEEKKKKDHKAQKYIRNLVDKYEARHHKYSVEEARLREDMKSVEAKIMNSSSKCHRRHVVFSQPSECAIYSSSSQDSILDQCYAREPHRHVVRRCPSLPSCEHYGFSRSCDYDRPHSRHGLHRARHATISQQIIDLQNEHRHYLEQLQFQLENEIIVSERLKSLEQQSPHHAQPAPPKDSDEIKQQDSNLSDMGDVSMYSVDSEDLSMIERLQALANDEFRMKENIHHLENKLDAIRNTASGTKSATSGNRSSDTEDERAHGTDNESSPAIYEIKCALSQTKKELMSETEALKNEVFELRTTILQLTKDYGNRNYETVTDTDLETENEVDIDEMELTKEDYGELEQSAEEEATDPNTLVCECVTCECEVEPTAEPVVESPVESECEDSVRGEQEDDDGVFESCTEVCDDEPVQIDAVEPELPAEEEAAEEEESVPIEEESEPIPVEECEPSPEEICEPSPEEECEAPPEEEALREICEDTCSGCCKLCPCAAKGQGEVVESDAEICQEAEEVAPEEVEMAQPPGDEEPSPDEPATEEVAEVEPEEEIEEVAEDAPEEEVAEAEPIEEVAEAAPEEEVAEAEPIEEVAEAAPEEEVAEAEPIEEVVEAAPEEEIAEAEPIEEVAEAEVEEIVAEEEVEEAEPAEEAIDAEVLENADVPSDEPVLEDASETEPPPEEPVGDDGPVLREEEIGTIEEPHESGCTCVDCKCGTYEFLAGGAGSPQMPSEIKAPAAEAQATAEAAVVEEKIEDESPDAEPVQEAAPEPIEADLSELESPAPAVESVREIQVADSDDEENDSECTCDTDCECMNTSDSEEEGEAPVADEVPAESQEVEEVVEEVIEEAVEEIQEESPVAEPEGDAIEEEIPVAAPEGGEIKEDVVAKEDEAKGDAEEDAISYEPCICELEVCECVTSSSEEEDEGVVEEVPVELIEEAEQMPVEQAEEAAVELLPPGDAENEEGVLCACGTDPCVCVSGENIVEPVEEVAVPPAELQVSAKPSAEAAVAEPLEEPLPKAESVQCICGTDPCECTCECSDEQVGPVDVPTEEAPVPSAPLEEAPVSEEAPVPEEAPVLEETAEVPPISPAPPVLVEQDVTCICGTEPCQCVSEVSLDLPIIEPVVSPDVIEALPEVPVETSEAPPAPVEELVEVSDVLPSEMVEETPTEPIEEAPAEPSTPIIADVPDDGQVHAGSLSSIKHKLSFTLEHVKECEACADNIGPAIHDIMTKVNALSEIIVSAEVCRQAKEDIPEPPPPDDEGAQPDTAGDGEEPPEPPAEEPPDEPFEDTTDEPFEESAEEPAIEEPTTEVSPTEEPVEEPIEEPAEEETFEEASEDVPVVEVLEVPSEPPVAAPVPEKESQPQNKALVSAAGSKKFAGTPFECMCLAICECVSDKDVAGRPGTTDKDRKRSVERSELQKMSTDIVSEVLVHAVELITESETKLFKEQAIAEEETVVHEPEIQEADELFEDAIEAPAEAPEEASEQPPEEAPPEEPLAEISEVAAAAAEVVAPSDEAQLAEDEITGMPAPIKAKEPEAEPVPIEAIESVAQPAPAEPAESVAVPAPIRAVDSAAVPTPAPIEAAESVAEPAPTEPVVSFAEPVPIAAVESVAPTPTPGVTPVESVAPTPTPGVTPVESVAPTPTPGVTPVESVAPTPTPGVTPVESVAPTPTPGVTPVESVAPAPTPGVTPVESVAPTPTPGVTPVESVAPTPTPGVTPVESVAPTPTPGVTPVESVAPAPTPGVTPVESVAPTPTPGVTPVESEAPTPTPGVTPVESAAPTPTPGVTPVESVAPTPTPGVTPVESEAPTPTPGVTPVESAAPTPTPGVTPVESVAPAPTPGVTPVESEAPAPTPGVTPVESEAPTPTPGVTPVESVAPTLEPETPVESEAPTPGVTPVESVAPTVELEAAVESEAVATPVLAPLEGVESVAESAAAEPAEPVAEPVAAEAVEPVAEAATVESVELAVEPEPVEAVEPVAEPETIEAVELAAEPSATVVEEPVVTIEEIAVELPEPEAEVAAVVSDQPEPPSVTGGDAMLEEELAVISFAEEAAPVPEEDEGAYETAEEDYVEVEEAPKPLAEQVASLHEELEAMQEEATQQPPEAEVPAEEPAVATTSAAAPETLEPGKGVDVQPSVRELEDQVMAPGVTISRLQAAFLMMKIKDRTKDHIITAMADELKIRAGSRVWQDMLASMAETDLDPKRVPDPDFDRTELCAYLSKPKLTDEAKRRIHERDGKFDPERRPSKFKGPLTVRIVRVIEPDSLLVSWEVAPNKCLSGFELFVNGVLAQRVHSPTRTQAVLHDLNLEENMTISVIAITPNGKCSNLPANVNYNGRLAVQ